MAAECAPVHQAGNLDPSCDAKFKKGGVNRRMYIGSLDDNPALSFDNEGNITGLTLPAGKYLRRVVGKKLLNSASVAIERSTSGVNFTQTVNFLAFFNTQREKNSIEGLAKAEDLFIILEQNDGMFDAYGLVSRGGSSDGLEMTSLAHSTGVNFNDSTAATLTFSGSSDALPVYCKLGVDNAAEVAILEALVLPEPLVQLATPNPFTATASSPTQINLTWSDVVNEDSYLIEVSDDNATWTSLATPSVGTTSYAHSGLTSGTTKNYRIKAVGNGTSYADSDYASATATTL